MKVLFVFIGANPNSPTATQNKMYEQIKNLNLAGVEAKGYFLTLTNADTPLKYIEYVKVKQYPGTFLKYPRQYNLYYKALDKLLGEEYHNFDFIYFRYPTAGRKLYRLSRKFGNKIILEHQSKELEDLSVNLKKWMKQKVNVANMLNFSEFFIYSYMTEKIFRKRILKKRVLHGVAVTNEIKEELTKEFAGKYSVSVISNGINSKDFPLRNHEQTDDKIRMLYLKGGSHDIPWAGLNRLIDAVRNEKKVELWIVGKEESELKHSFIKQLGYKKGKELDDIFNQVDIGVNHLALYVIGLNESCNLKTREYFSRGLPFIYAADDTDLINNSEGKIYCLQVPNDDSPIDFAEIKLFLGRMQQYNNLGEDMKMFAEQNMDWKVKVILFREMFEKLSR